MKRREKFSPVGVSVFLASTSILLLTGCSGVASTDWFAADEQGRVLIATDRSGMEALNDLVSGLVINGKASADTKDTPSIQLRREQNQIRALKFQSKSKK